MFSRQKCFYNITIQILILCWQCSNRAALFRSQCQWMIVNISQYDIRAERRSIWFEIYWLNHSTTEIQSRGRVEVKFQRKPKAIDSSTIDKSFLKFFRLYWIEKEKRIEEESYGISRMFSFLQLLPLDDNDIESCHMSIS